MPPKILQRSPVLIVTAGGRACAIPLEDVEETMRPLPIVKVAGMPGFVRGVAVIRGAPTAVIDLEALLEGGGNTADDGRFVTLKLGARRVAISVERVVGLRELDPAQLIDLPLLLGGAAADLIEAIGTSDAQLLVVLRSARLVPEEVWTTLAGATAR